MSVDQIRVGDHFIVDVEGNAFFRCLRNACTSDTGEIEAETSVVNLDYGTRIEVIGRCVVWNSIPAWKCRILDDEDEDKGERSPPRIVLMNSKWSADRTLRMYGLRRMTPLECLAHEGEWNS